MVLGIVVAVVAFLVVFLVGNRGGGGDTTRDTNVIVAAVDIPAGSQIVKTAVKTVKYAAADVPGNAIGKDDDASGQFAAIAISKGTVLTSDNLVPTQSKLPAQRKPYLDIPSGFVAIAIPQGAELQNVAGYIQQEDKIDIIWNPPLSEKQPDNVWKTTFQNMRVARAPQAPAAGSGGSAAAPTSSSFVVFVPLDQAEDLSLIFSTGNFKLALKAQVDIGKDEVTSTAGSTQGSVQAKFNVPK
jgi:Flp pilus assembly protein CpaB